jgi:hypothetical protein
MDKSGGINVVAIYAAIFYYPGCAANHFSFCTSFTALLMGGVGK